MKNVNKIDKQSKTLFNKNNEMNKTQNKITNKKI